MTDSKSAAAINDDEQRIFAERFESLTNGFNEACTNNNVDLAIAIAIHPESNRPVIYARGHNYDIAALLANILRGLKMDLLKELDTEIAARPKSQR